MLADGLTDTLVSWDWDRGLDKGYFILEESEGGYLYRLPADYPNEGLNKYLGRRVQWHGGKLKTMPELSHAE